jgi:hypothetical protein
MCEYVIVIAGGTTSRAVIPAPPSRKTHWHRARAVLETLLIAGGFAVLFFLLPHSLRGDDNVRFHDIETLLQHGKLTNSRFSLVMPLISVPVLMLGDLVKSQSWWAVHFNVIVVAVGVLVAYFQLRKRLDARLFRLIVLVLLFASFLTNRLRDYNAETLTSTLVTLGIICLVTRRHVFAGWTAIVIGVVNTPAAIVALALMSVVHTVRTRKLRHLAPVAAAAGLIMLEAWIRRGGPFVTGYGRQSFSYTFLLGLAAVLFSFGRGLLFFTPGLVLWLDRRRRRQLPGREARQAVELMMAFAAGLIVTYSKWWAWFGGLSWGPRFFLFAAVPASVMLAVGIWRAGRAWQADLATLVVLALSAWVSFAGVVPNLRAALSECTADGYKFEANCWYTPQYSSLWEPVRLLHEYTATTSARVVTLCVIVVFVYLAVPLVASLLRAALPRRSWAAGWQV